MKIAGIVAEYNPFHNGHAYQIDIARREGCTHIAAVMSGCFTQRGEPACMGKAARAEAALRCGVDLMLELPAPWACASAETFAFGAVSILDALGCVEAVCFGSESADAARIEQTARMVLAVIGCPEFQEALSRGLSFPSARQAAVEARFPAADTRLLRDPNDTLGVEYCKAVIRLGSGMTMLPVKRAGAGHDAAELVTVLVSEFVAMGEHAGLGVGIGDHAPRDSREHDRLAGPGWGYGERVSVLRERADASLDEQFLARSQQHG